MCPKNCKRIFIHKKIRQLKLVLSEGVNDYGLKPVA